MQAKLLVTRVGAEGSSAAEACAIRMPVEDTGA
eukprot:CAMPEP_0171090932 /NCGR_PEP_ID=MMETSP0766_2-20121228/32144_1 /TAXON_ID=439317 /ORGANISM="Gambierdiscus australes, Strain CAWD 149" /LENGTH=32 /DNA_ID= /DNA_START= /DNA_END= /DNA_ORIENTATION=